MMSEGIFTSGIRLTQRTHMIREQNDKGGKNMDYATNIQNVITTLEGLEIKSSYDNMDRLLGCMQLLARIRDELRKKPEVNDGNADSE